MTATSHARRDDSDGIITVTFTRDDKRNAVSLEMFDVLQAAVLDLADDDRHRVLVVTAEGRYFTGGLDMADLVGPLGEGTEGVVRGSNIRREYRMRAHHDFFDEMEQVEKPIVLAAQGPCFGVGVEFGVSCDFRLASDVTTFALPEVAKLGVLPGSGGISRLTRIVGPHWARWLTMAGQVIDADQAVNIGLVHTVYPASSLPNGCRPSPDTSQACLVRPSGWRRSPSTPRRASTVARGSSTGSPRAPCTRRPGSPSTSTPSWRRRRAERHGRVGTGGCSCEGS